MKSYNTKNWLTVFTFYRHDTLRLLWPALVLLGLYTYGVDHWLSNQPQVLNGTVLKNLSIVHSLLGLVISLLLVFRTNTAYDRWWEGRKLWGALVNNSRNLAMRLNALLSSNDSMDRQFFRVYIPLYSKALSQHLKSKAVELQLDEKEHPELVKLDPEKHLPNQIASMIHHRIYSLHSEKKISGDALITLSSEVGSFTDICGACERIKNTPIPFSYSSFIKRFIILYVATLPWSLVSNLGYWSIPVVLFVMYALSSLEVIAEEIEEPFGEDANDLPTDRIADNIAKQVAELL
jgi:putative membrane protein